MPDTSPRGEQVADDKDTILATAPVLSQCHTAAPWPAIIACTITSARDAAWRLSRHSLTSAEPRHQRHSMGGHGALIMALKIRANTPASLLCAYRQPQPRAVGNQSATGLSRRR